MSYRFGVNCFINGGRLWVYTGESILGAWRAYRKAKREGGQWFVLEWRPS